MTLENKLNITDSTLLAQEEEKLSKTAAVYLYDSGLLDSLTPGTFESLTVIHRELFGKIYLLDSLTPGTFESLTVIHRELFGKIYDFAGRIRSVNLAKGNFRFASVMYLESALEKIEQMPQRTFDEIVEKYVEMNVAHPFREGNGRAARIWLDLILKKELAQVIDWSKIDKDDYLFAMERSPVRDTEIKILLKNALTGNINDRELFMKGIDHSYAYEGYSAYSAGDLSL